jgi:hypothetical protein
MVHGQSSLYNPIASLEQGNERDDEMHDATEQLLRLIDRKYGLLTLEGQKAKPAEPATYCSEECIAKVNEYLDRNPGDDSWLPGQPLADNNDDVLSEPNTLFC